jgi:hypothetical protein
MSSPSSDSGFMDILRMITSISHNTLKEFDTNYKEVNTSTSSTFEGLFGKKAVPTNISKDNDEKSKDNDDNRLVCQICFSNLRNITYQPCQHILTCNTCSLEMIKIKRNNCSYCNQPIEKYINVRFP